MSPKRPRVSDATKRRRLRAFALKGIARFHLEHDDIHRNIVACSTVKRYGVRSKDCLLECLPYRRLIRAGQEALRS